ncbi:MAG: hypothetical protein ACI4WT_01140 [Oligosphaeraceae bacterium]
MGVISTLKRAHLLGRAACGGEGRVRAELLCKVIAYDLMLPSPAREVRAHGRRRPARTA